MAYIIKVKNSQGTYTTPKFNNKAKAMQIIKNNKKADTLLNSKGLRSISSGRLVNLKNKYKLIKVRD